MIAASGVFAGNQDRFGSLDERPALAEATYLAEYGTLPK
ncbi:hypothetical protein ASAP_0970 [Asaia bogorensis]|uniref:Uncharacterized protein n=1 Tax=Asaia bogorensis TaxID=91915 RepID=A0A060QDK1_9PROT|nr:hypothetical protein P792_11560 [Asaia sp. SF2.1]CDG39015.1 hypothetical protein ASAP_0970 [Asaia bogorensis]